MISTNPPRRNSMRNSAGLGYTQLMQIPPGGEIDIISGPRCADGYVWWQVRYNGQTGWTVEGDAGVAWVVRVGGGTTSIVTSSNTYLQSCRENPGDGCYHGAHPSEARVIFINGIANTLNDSEVSRILVDGQYPASSPVMGLFNEGISANQGYTDTFRSATTRNLRDYLLEFGCNVTLIGHSQGGAVIADALRETSSSCQEEVRVRTFGSPAINWPEDITQAVHCYFMLDAVTTISRFTSEDAQMIPSFSARIDWEHGFDSYLVYARECGMP